VEGGVDAGEEFGTRSSIIAGQGPEGAAGRDVAADCGAEGGKEGNDEEADGAAGGAGGLAIDFGDGEGGVGGEDGVEVVDGVEDGDEVEEAGPEADDHLGEDGFGDVFAGVGDFFCEMGDCIRSADSVGAIEHASDEDEAVGGVACSIRPFVPHERVWGVSHAGCGGHDGADDDGDNDTGEDKKAAEDFNLGQSPIS